MSLLTSLMPNAFRQRIDYWIALRTPASRGKITLHNRRLYILPTRFGYLYAVMVFVLLLAAINYENSMAFALTFLLTAIGIVSLWQTHKNLLGLSIQLKPPEAVFCGEDITLNFNISNPNLSSRYAVGIQYPHHYPEYTSIDPESNADLSLELPTHTRGLYQAAGLTLFTRYPTGLFHAWGWLKFDCPLLVYPTPLFDHKLKQSLVEDQPGKSNVDTVDGDDFAGLREHRRGESLRHISWKALAQGRGMLTKTFQGYATPSLWIDWKDMSAASVEGKLGQMSALIIQAHQQGRKFGLMLPSTTIQQDSGFTHRSHCLQQLATFRQRDINSELLIDET
jgi:uncharacterized protein (DUF58 family)